MEMLFLLSIFIFPRLRFPSEAYMALEPPKVVDILIIAHLPVLPSFSNLISLKLYSGGENKHWYRRGVLRGNC